jgi:6-phosphofructokinase
MAKKNKWIGILNAGGDGPVLYSAIRCWQGSARLL